jgi:hypothetical protein
MGVLVAGTVGSGDGTVVLAGKVAAGAQATSMTIQINVIRIFFIWVSVS